MNESANIFQELIIIYLERDKYTKINNELMYDRSDSKKFTSVNTDFSQCSSDGFPNLFRQRHFISLANKQNLSQITLHKTNKEPD